MKNFILLFLALITTSMAVKAQEPEFVKKQTIQGVYGPYYIDYYYDHNSGQYLGKSDYIKKYGRQVWKTNKENQNKNKPLVIPELKNENNPLVIPELKNKKLALKPRNVIAGGSIIGLSLSATLITEAAINSSIENKTAELSRLSSEMSISRYDDKAGYEKRIADISDKIDRLQKTQKTMRLVYAGTSLVGVVVLLTGLEYTYDGVKITDDLSFNGSGVTMRF